MKVSGLRGVEFCDGTGRISSPGWPHASNLNKLPQAVLALDLVFGQASDAGERAAAVGHRHGDHDFVGAGGVVDSDFHAVEMAADERCVLVAERDVERNAEGSR